MSDHQFEWQTVPHFIFLRFPLFIIVLNIFLHTFRTALHSIIIFASTIKLISKTQEEKESLLYLPQFFSFFLFFLSLSFFLFFFLSFFFFFGLLSLQGRTSGIWSFPG